MNQICAITWEITGSLTIMQKRLMPLLIVAGLLIAAVAGLFLVSGSDDAEKLSGRDVQLSVSPAIVEPKAEDAVPQRQQEEIKQNEEEIIIPAPVLKSETEPKTDAGASKPEEDNSNTLSLATEETEVEPLFAITVARVNPDGSSIFAGVAEADATIQLQDGTNLLDETVSDSNGEWVSIPARKLSAGPHIIILTMRTKDGRIATANTSLVVEIAETKTEKPLVAIVPQDDTTAPVLLQSPDLDADIEVIEEDVAEIVVPASVPAINIQSLSLTDNGGLLVRGRFSAGHHISGQLGTKSMSDIAIDNSGRWSGLIDISDLSQAPQTLDVKLFDDANNIVAQTALELDENNINPGLKDSQMVVVQKGDALWRIAYRTYGKGVRYVEIVRRNQDQISDPDMIFPNQIFVLPK